MASTVSGRPGPVPGAGGNCAFATLGSAALNALASKMTTNRLNQKFTLPPKRSAWNFRRPTINCRLRTCKRPLLLLPGPDQKRHNSEYNLQQSPFSRRAGSPKEPKPADHCQNRGHRIKPHLEGKLF